MKRRFDTNTVAGSLVTPFAFMWQKHRRLINEEHFHENFRRKDSAQTTRSNKTRDSETLHAMHRSIGSLQKARQDDIIC